MLENYVEAFDTIRQPANLFGEFWLSNRSKHYLVAEAKAINEVIKLCYDSDKEKMLHNVKMNQNVFNILPPLVKLEDQE